MIRLPTPPPAAACALSAAPPAVVRAAGGTCDTRWERRAGLLLPPVPQKRRHAGHHLPPDEAQRRAQPRPHVAAGLGGWHNRSNRDRSRCRRAYRRRDPSLGRLPERQDGPTRAGLQTCLALPAQALFHLRHAIHHADGPCGAGIRAQAAAYTTRLVNVYHSYHLLSSKATRGAAFPGCWQAREPAPRVSIGAIRC